VSHRKCAADKKRNERQREKQREEKPTRRENGHAKRHWGRDCQYTRRHLIRKPAKLPGTSRSELCTLGGAHQNLMWVA
jgi:hypothetical protein